MSRLRNGHLTVKHSTGHCDQWDKETNVEHVLISCGKHEEERRCAMTGRQRAGRVEAAISDGPSQCGDAEEGANLISGYLRATYFQSVAA